MLQGLALLVAVAYNAALAPQPFPSVVSVASDATPSELYVVVRGLAPLKIYIIIADLHEITISETISLALPRPPSPTLCSGTQRTCWSAH